MAIVNGWLDWADTSVRGPAQKVYAEPNKSLGIVFHDAEGWRDGNFHELLNPAREASWMATCMVDGTLFQHYPVTAACWASGNHVANTSYWSMELEGLAPTPASAAQAATVRRLIAEFEAHTGLKAERHKTIFEHREVWNLATPNAGPTACPSERYSAVWAQLAQENGPMTSDELKRLERVERLLIGNGTDAICRPGLEHLFPPGTQVFPEGVDPPEGYVKPVLTGENALAYADARSFSLALAAERH